LFGVKIPHDREGRPVAKPQPKKIEEKNFTAENAKHAEGKELH
jgi:hypothetical protein